MKTNTFLRLKLNLRLFDGGAAAGGAAGAGAAAAEGAGSAAAESQGAPANSRTGKTTGGLDNVFYGKQTEDISTPDAGEKHTSSDDPKERSKRFKAMISGEFKDDFTQETQRIINSRFKETKGYQETIAGQQPIMDLLADRYGTSDPAQLAERLRGDSALWEDKAAEADMTVEQYQAFAQMQRENAAMRNAEVARRGREAADRQMMIWKQEEAELQQEYPDFRLEEEAKNPVFLGFLRSHMPVREAYRHAHMDELIERQATETERRVTDNVRARGNRPAEGGASSSAGFITKPDPSTWSKADRAEVARRIARGEVIKL